MPLGIYDQFLKMLEKWLISHITPESTWFLPWSYLYKSQQRSIMKYCCHIWTGAAQYSRSSFDRVQKRLLGLVGYELFYTLQLLLHRQNVACLSLFRCYFYDSCLNQLRSLVLPVQIFTTTMPRTQSQSIPFVFH